MDNIYKYLESETFSPPEGFDKKRDDVKYGELTEIEYYSGTTACMRKALIYTPPGYDSSTVYPVLFLLHGIGGTHTEWKSGAPNEIISNLIASGEAPPMIAVMPNVRAKQSPEIGEMLSAENIAAFDNFINDLRDDLLPFLGENYPVSGNRSDCAIAGLSMGGRETLYIITRMPEVFGYAGAFCPAPGLIAENLGIPAQLEPGNLTLPGDYINSTFIMINTGNQDGVVGDNPVNYHKTLTGNGVRNFFYSVEGGHDFNVWKNGLYYFVKCIF